MRKRGKFLLLGSLIMGLFHAPKKNKQTSETANAVNPIFFVGNWKYLDKHNHQHSLGVEPDLTLKIDGFAIPTTVLSLTKYKISYVDNYGYHLALTANEARPIKFYDEADNFTYNIIAD